MLVRAPAKLNLGLAVGPLRDDGYHDLQTVFCAVGLYDRLSAEVADELTVEVQGEGAGDVPTDRANLAVRAVELLAEVTGCSPGVALRLDKAIPVAGGCAGGSADAAAALVACDALWGTGLSRDALAEVGARLGSDVPFALHGGVALGTGRGERLTPVLAHPSLTFVLAVADGGLSTPAVYRELDRLRAQGPPRLASDPAPVLAALRSGDAVALGRALHNDLEEAAVSLRPDLRRLLEAGRQLGALGALVSGSGPTVALLVPDARTGQALAGALGKSGTCRTTAVVPGPVAGATVVG